MGTSRGKGLAQHGAKDAEMAVMDCSDKSLNEADTFERSKHLSRCPAKKHNLGQEN
jgi:hypothetical protein